MKESPKGLQIESNYEFTKFVIYKIYISQFFTEAMPSRCIHLPHLDLLSGHTGTQGLHFLRATRLRVGTDCRTWIPCS